MTRWPEQASRTLLEALVRQRRWSHRDFCRAYAGAAAELGLSLTISPQHAGRWFGGKLKGMPYPAQCRVLEHLLRVDVSHLFSSPGIDPSRSVVRDDGGQDGSSCRCNDEEITMAADEAAQFAQRTEQTNVGPHTLEQFAADIRRIVAGYSNQPLYPTFLEVRALRSRAFEKLEGRQFPSQARDLYLVSGLLCGILANAAFDLGHLDAAATQARTAFLCAELAGHNGLRAWIRGTQSMIAYWDERPVAAVELAQSGRRYAPEVGTALVRLAALEARAHGRMGDKAEMEVALGFAAEARDAVAGEDEPGGMMSFPEAKQAYCAATARLWLGDPDSARQAERDAGWAVHRYENDPPEQRRLGELNLARLDVATARIALGELDGAAVAVRRVLEAYARRPTGSVTCRLRQVRARLGEPRWRNDPLAAELADEVATHVRKPSGVAITGGQQQ